MALVPTPSVAEHNVTSLLTLYSALKPSLLPITFLLCEVLINLRASDIK